MNTWRKWNGLPATPSAPARAATAVATPVKPKPVEVVKPVIKPLVINTSPVARSQEKQKYPNFTNLIGCEMPLVTSGQFTMGSAGGSASPEQPLTQVTIGCFFMARFPITNGQYEMFDASHQAKRGPRANEASGDLRECRARGKVLPARPEGRQE